MDRSDRRAPAGDCSIAATVQIIGDRWSLLILRDAFRGIRRFDEFQRDLGIARNLLTDRLHRLVEHGIFDKVAYQDRPVRYEYRLTRKGVELSPSLVALMKWGDAWTAGESGPPVVLVHDECGFPVEQTFHCSECDCTVTPLHLRNRHLTTSPSNTSTSDNSPSLAPTHHVDLDELAPELDHAHVL
jgi:DNA-binding HxlR family transcriptional regulator